MTCEHLLRFELFFDRERSGIWTSLRAPLSHYKGKSKILNDTKPFELTGYNEIHPGSKHPSMVPKTENQPGMWTIATIPEHRLREQIMIVSIIIRKLKFRFSFSKSKPRFPWALCCFPGVPYPSPGPDAARFWHSHIAWTLFQQKLKLFQICDMKKWRFSGDLFGSSALCGSSSAKTHLSQSFLTLRYNFSERIKKDLLKNRRK